MTLCLKCPVSSDLASCLRYVGAVCVSVHASEVESTAFLRPLCQIVFFSDLCLVNKDGLICSLKTVLCKAFRPGVCIIFTVSTLQTQERANATDGSHAQVMS